MDYIDTSPVRLNSINLQAPRSSVEQQLPPVPMEIYARPAAFIKSAESDLSDACALLIEEWFSDVTPDFYLHVIGNSSSSKSANNATRMPSFRMDLREAFEEGVKQLAECLNLYIVTPGLGSDLFSHLCGHVIRSLDEDRLYRQRHEHLIAEQQGDWDFKSLTDVKLIGINSAEILPDWVPSGTSRIGCDESLDFPLISGAHLEDVDPWHTHFVFAEDVPLLDSNRYLMQAKFTLKMVKFLGRIRDCSAGIEEARYVTLPKRNVVPTISNNSNVGEVRSLHGDAAVSAYQRPGLAAVAFLATNNWSSLEGTLHLMSGGVPVIILEGFSTVGDLLVWYSHFLKHSNITEADSKVFISTVRRKLDMCFDRNNESSFDLVFDWLMKIGELIKKSPSLLSSWELNVVNVKNLSYLLVSCLCDFWQSSAIFSAKDVCPILLGLLNRTCILSLAYDRVCLPDNAFRETWFRELFQEILLVPGRERMAKFYLDQGLKVEEFLNAELYIRLFKETQYRGFLDRVVLGHAMGYPEFPYDPRRFLRVDLNQFLHRLTDLGKMIPHRFMETMSSSVENSMPCNLGQSVQERQLYDSLVLWACLTNRGELAKLLWAYASDPVPLALVLSHLFHALAIQSQDWYLYEEHMRRLADEFANLSVELLQESFKHSPYRAYDVLCNALDQYQGATAVHLAYMSENKTFIAHECCQRWVSRLLYGPVRIRSWKCGSRLFGGSFELPSWLKVLLSAIFVVPVWFWVTIVLPVMPSVHREETEISNCLDASSYAGSSLYSSPRVVRGGRRFTSEIRAPRTLTLTQLRQITQSNCSVASLKSFAARSQKSQTNLHAVQRDPGESFSLLTGFSGSQPPLAMSEPSGGVTTDVDGIDEIQRSGVEQTSPFSDRDQDPMADEFERPEVTVQITTPKSRDVSPGSKGSRIGAAGITCLDKLCAFYTTPVAKYWLSLVFRLIFLCIFAVALAQPFCGNLTLDLLVWVWAFISWTEACLVLYWKQQRLKVGCLFWEIFDVCLVGIFLILMLLLRFIAREQHGLISTPLAGRAVLACFMLYFCYHTLFTYVPMSQSLGPFLVRIRLMVCRDLARFLVLVCVVICSFAVIIHAIIYPNFEPNSLLWYRAFHRAWFTLFTTEIGDLHESEQCSKLKIDGQGYCGRGSPYNQPDCPVPSWVAYIMLVQYLIIIKLIAWPLLFALFGRTAQEVEKQAEEIWKYQFYGLVNDFSLKPPLPPPFTPLVFAFLLTSKAAAGLKAALFSRGGDHPDAGTIYLGTVIQKVRQRDADYFEYWRSLAKRLYERKYAGSNEEMMKIRRRGSLKEIQREIECLRDSLELMEKDDRAG